MNRHFRFTSDLFFALASVASLSAQQPESVVPPHPGGAAVPFLESGDRISGVLPPGGASHGFDFHANAGDRVLITVCGMCASPRVQPRVEVNFAGSGPRGFSMGVHHAMQAEKSSPTTGVHRLLLWDGPSLTPGGGGAYALNLHVFPWFTNAVPMAPGVAVRDVLDGPGDVDLFEVALNAGDRVDIDVIPQPQPGGLPADLDPVIRVYPLAGGGPIQFPHPVHGTLRDHCVNPAGVPQGAPLRCTFANTAAGPESYTISVEDSATQDTGPYDIVVRWVAGVPPAGPANDFVLYRICSKGTAPSPRLQVRGSVDFRVRGFSPGAPTFLLLGFPVFPAPLLGYVGLKDIVNPLWSTPIAINAGGSGMLTVPLAPGTSVPTNMLFQAVSFSSAGLLDDATNIARRQ